jgi:hypothetical protein
MMRSGCTGGRTAFGLGAAIGSLPEGADGDIFSNRLEETASGTNAQ